MNDSKRPALSRTWDTVTVYRECGVTVDVARVSVTLSREGRGRAAERHRERRSVRTGARRRHPADR